MKTRSELAETFMAALLARDPLPAQRFTEIDARLQQLAHIAQKCAVTFLAVNLEWEKSPERANAIVKRLWDYTAAGATEVPVPPKLTGAAVGKDRDAELFGRNDLS